MDSKTKRRHHAALCRSVRQSGDTRREASLTCSDYCVANGAPLLLLAALMMLIAVPVQANCLLGSSICSWTDAQALDGYQVIGNNQTIDVHITEADVQAACAEQGYSYRNTGNQWEFSWVSHYYDKQALPFWGNSWTFIGPPGIDYGYTFENIASERNAHCPEVNKSNCFVAIAGMCNTSTGYYGYTDIYELLATDLPPEEWDQTDFSCIPLFGPINQSVDCISETSPQPDTFTWRLERPNGTVSWDENNLDTITFIADEPGFYDVDLKVTLGDLETWINKTDYISIQGTQGNMTPWQTAPNVSLKIDPVGTLAPWSIWNSSTVRGDLETTFGNWSVPYLDMVDGMVSGLDTLFDSFLGLVNWAPLKILAMLQMVNGTLGSVIAAVSSSANILLQIMAHSLNALPWQLQGLLCYRITLDFVYLLLRGET